MKIIDSIRQNKQFISFEFFPPKAREEWPVFFQTVERLVQLKPLFASVTYGAGGSANAESLEIVTRLQQEYVLALRGDLPQAEPVESLNSSPLKYASDLVDMIRSSFPSMGIGIAGYPEVHPDAENHETDLSYLKMKLDRGADFAITQLFFDNSLYHSFVKRAREAGITKLIIPGILPVVSLKVVKRIVSLCGASIPAEFLAELEQADREGGAAAVQKVGVAHARKQIRELLDSGVPGIHLYTLNRAEVVIELLDGIEP